MKELTIEQKAQRYDEAIKKAKDFYKGYKQRDNQLYANDLETTFPELRESKDEEIRQKFIKLVKMSNEVGGFALHKWEADEMLAWLEKQGKETNWKPSKEEMDVLYGLAYITNQYDEHKEEVITRLYQDLKREFFNGSSYENMFPNTEDGVRRRSTIQVLEYARSLDTYNQYGKADIDKNIAWLEKQGEPRVNMIQWKGDNLKEVIEFTGKSPKFGEWFKTWEEYENYVHSHGNIFKLFCEDGSHYEVPVSAWIVKTPDGYNIASKAKYKQNIEQKPYGQREECLDCRFNYVGECKGFCQMKRDEQKPIIEMKSAEESLGISSEEYNDIVNECLYGESKSFKVGDWITNGDYTWKIIEVKPLDYILQSQDGNIVDDTISHVDEQFHSFTIKDAKDGDVLFHSDSASNGIFIFKEIIDKGFGNEVICYCDYDSEDHFCLGEHHACCWTDAKILHPATKEQRDLLFSKMRESGYEFDFEKKELKKLSQRMISAEAKEALYDKPAWSEEDDNCLSTIIAEFSKCSGKSVSKDEWMRCNDFLNSLKGRVQPQKQWKPSAGQMKALHDLNLAGNISYAGQGQTLIELYNDLKKLKGE